jgi:hypothetical protein
MLNNKYFWIVLIIYAIPAFFGTAIMASSGLYIGGQEDWFLTLIFNIVISPISIVLGISLATQYPYGPYLTPIIEIGLVCTLLYYVISYSLLFIYYRHEKKVSQITKFTKKDMHNE